MRSMRFLGLCCSSLLCCVFYFQFCDPCFIYKIITWTRQYFIIMLNPLKKVKIDSPTKKKFQNFVFSALQKKKEGQNKSILKKITELWLRGDNHEEKINFQRVLYILKLYPTTRNDEQIEFLRDYFETRYSYLQKIKGKLDEENYLQLYREMLLESYEQYEILFNHGETGRKMYFILSGEVGILLPTGKGLPSPTNKKTVKTFEDMVNTYYSDLRLVAVKKTGEYFGEIAIEQRIPRTATVITKQASHFAILTFESYQRIIGIYQDKITQERMSFISSIPYFSKWSKSAKLVLLHSCEDQFYQTNTIVYKKGFRDKYVYLIHDGEVILERWVKKENQRVETVNVMHRRQLQRLMTNAKQGWGFICDEVGEAGGRRVFEGPFVRGLGAEGGRVQEGKHSEADGGEDAGGHEGVPDPDLPVPGLHAAVLVAGGAGPLHQGGGREEEGEGEGRGEGRGSGVPDRLPGRAEPVLPVAAEEAAAEGGGREGRERGGESEGHVHEEVHVQRAVQAGPAEQPGGDRVDHLAQEEALAAQRQEQERPGDLPAGRLDHQHHPQGRPQEGQALQQVPLQREVQRRLHPQHLLQAPREGTPFSANNSQSKSTLYTSLHEHKPTRELAATSHHNSHNKIVNRRKNQGSQSQDLDQMQMYNFESSKKQQQSKKAPSYKFELVQQASGKVHL